MAKTIDPHDIDLIWSNVTANTEDEWSDVVTYDLGDLVQVTTTTPHMVYRSLRGNNLNRPPADHLETVVETATSTSSVAVETGAKSFTIAAGKSFIVGDVLKIAKTQTPRSVHMTAEVTDYTTTTLQVSVYATTGDGTHASWTISTEDEIGFWEEVGATDQWLMFDKNKETKTANADEIHVRLATERVDYVALFGVTGKTIELTLWDATPDVFTLYLGGATGGTFALGDGTTDTSAIAYDASAATIETELEAIFGEYVTVAVDTDFTITFDKAVGVTGLEADFSTLTGATAPALTQTSTPGELWSGEIDLAYASAIVAQISDWYEYFFGEYALKEEAEKQLGVITYEGVLEIKIIAETGTDAECGNVIAGRVYEIGSTQYGARAGLVDYPDYSAKRNELTLYLPNHLVDPVYRKLFELKGVTTAWLGNENEGEYEAFIVLGKFLDAAVTVAGPSHSWITLDIEG
jgi:hypothetical protein